MILTFDQAFGQGGAATAAASPESFSAPVSEPQVTQAASQPQAQAPQQPQASQPQSPQVVPFDQAFAASPQQTADTQMGGTTQPQAPTGTQPSTSAPAGQTPQGQTPQGPDSLSLAGQANSLLQKGGQALSQFLPGATQNIGGSGLNLGDVSGPLSLATGIAHGNVGQAVAGAVGTASTIARFAGSQLDMPGLTTASNAIGALAGPLSLAMGIKSGDPAGIVSGAIGTYNAVNTLITSLGGEALPGAASTLASIAPETAAAIANTFSAGATVAADAGAEAISAALSASLATVGAAAAPIIMGVMAYISEQQAKNAREAGYANNPIAGQLYSNATAGVGAALNVQKQVDAAGGVEKASNQVLSSSLGAQLNGLMGYFATAQGPAGPVRASSAVTGMFGRQGLGGAAQYTANGQQVGTNIGDTVNQLLKNGVTYEDIGKIPVSGEWVYGKDLEVPLDGNYAAGKAKYDAEGAQLIQKIMGTTTQQPTQWDYSQEGGPQSSPGGITIADPTNPGTTMTLDPSMLTPDALFKAAQGSAFAGPDSVTKASGLVTSMYGGAAWYAIAASGVANSNPALKAQIQAHFDPWAVIRNESPQQLWTTMQSVYSMKMQEQARAQGQALGSPGGNGPGTPGGGPGAGPGGPGSGSSGAGPAAGSGSGSGVGTGGGVAGAGIGEGEGGPGAPGDSGDGPGGSGGSGGGSGDGDGGGE